MSENYWTVYGEAAEIYSDPGRTEGKAYNDMQRCLGTAVREGRISDMERSRIAAAIMRAADPQLDYELTQAGF